MLLIFFQGMFELHKSYLERFKYNLLDSHYFWRIGLGKVG